MQLNYINVCVRAYAYILADIERQGTIDHLGDEVKSKVHPGNSVGKAVENA
jgi:hypothetical protein